MKKMNDDVMSPAELRGVYRAYFIKAILNKKITDFNTNWNTYWSLVEKDKVDPKILFSSDNADGLGTILTMAIKAKKNEITSAIIHKYQSLTQIPSQTPNSPEEDQFKAWIDDTNVDNLTALDLAIEYENVAIAKLLLNAGANDEPLKEALLDETLRKENPVLLNFISKLLSNEYKGYKIEPLTELKSQFLPQKQYYATVTDTNLPRPLNLTFDLEEVEGAGSCMFLANGVTRKDWVDFLQYYLNLWRKDPNNVENFKSLLSAIRADILSMFENDFALQGNNNINSIKAKEALYNDLYQIQKSLYPSDPSYPPSPYPNLVNFFLVGKNTGDWTLFNTECDKFETALMHLQSYRVDSYEKLKFWPSLPLMIKFAQLRHQLNDLSGKINYHVIWGQNSSNSTQLSLLYPTATEFLSWFEAGKSLNHAIFHISQVHFNKLKLIKHNVEQQSQNENLEIKNNLGINNQDEEEKQLQLAIAKSLELQLETKKLDSDLEKKQIPLATQKYMPPRKSSSEIPFIQNGDSDDEDEQFQLQQTLEKSKKENEQDEEEKQFQLAIQKSILPEELPLETKNPNSNRNKKHNEKENHVKFVIEMVTAFKESNKDDGPLELAIRNSLMEDEFNRAKKMSLELQSNNLEIKNNNTQEKMADDDEDEDQDDAKQLEQAIRLSMKSQSKTDEDEMEIEDDEDDELKLAKLVSMQSKTDNTEIENNNIAVKPRAMSLEISGHSPGLFHPSNSASVSNQTSSSSSNPNSIIPRPPAT